MTGGPLTATYGPDGLRASKTAAPASGAGALTTYYLYDGDRPLVEMSAAGQVTAANGFSGDGWRQRCSHDAVGQ